MNALYEFNVQDTGIEGLEVIGRFEEIPRRTSSSLEEEAYANADIEDRDRHVYVMLLDVPFKCDGCHQVGIGSRFSYALCNFDLHTHCADASPNSAALSTLNVFFQILPYLLGDSPRYCNATTLAAKISTALYHCRKCGYDLHPCCAALPHVLNADSNLHHKTSTPCDKCVWKGTSWCYRSDSKKFNFHVDCTIKMWLDNWNELYYGRGSSSGDNRDGMTMVLPVGE
ncbi:hypothetical protein M5K25_002363 [Dendrobium thyrsiflorum]|uniref:DC1 domain-containing protein n=1 Tax=Dendrobium thyrsiflorum TaxID=117978 RepID=A0ABD0W4H5_DENTH